MTWGMLAALFFAVAVVLFLAAATGGHGLHNPEVWAAVFIAAGLLVMAIPAGWSWFRRR